MLTEAGYSSVHVSPRMVYVDASKPELVEGFTKKTFAAMIEGVRSLALQSDLIGEADFDRGIADLYRTAEADGVFCYTFFKALAVNTQFQMIGRYRATGSTEFGSPSTHTSRAELHSSRTAFSP